MKAEYIVAIFAFTGTIIAAVIGLYSLTGKPDLILADSSPYILSIDNNGKAITVLDIKIKNSGSDSTFIKRVSIETIKLKTFEDPIESPKSKDLLLLLSKHHATPPDSIYQFDLSSIYNSKVESLNISRTVEPFKTDRFLLLLIANSPLLSKVTLKLEADQNTTITSKPFNIIITSNSLSPNTPLKRNLNDEAYAKILNNKATTKNILEFLDRYNIEKPKWL